MRLSHFFDKIKLMGLSLEQFSNKFIKDLPHATHVRDLSLIIFDEVCKNIKELTPKQRKYLDAGAFLHDIGYAVQSKSHNKFSQQLILENEIDGFSQKENEIISCIARYHRNPKPDKKKHEIYCNFDKKERKTIKRLAGILRIADGLDRNHSALIKNIKIEYDKENSICVFKLFPKNSEYRPDISEAIKKRDLFEDGYKVQTIFIYAI